MTGQELHMDGSSEPKLFAAGYGEVFTGGAGGDVEALALAVPTDASSDPMPAEYTTLESGAHSVFDAAEAGNWHAASATVGDMTNAWDTLRTGGVPRLIVPWMTRGIDSLSKAVKARDAAAARQWAIEADQRILDMELRYRDPVDINLSRLDLWAAQIQVDAAAGDAAAVNGDVFSLFYIRDRVLAALSPSDLTNLNIEFNKLQVAGPNGNLVGAVKAAISLRELLAKVLAGR